MESKFLNYCKVYVNTENIFSISNGRSIFISLVT